MTQQRKRCSKCRQVKPRSEFYSRKAASDGLHSSCKPCRNADALVSQKASRDRVRHPELTYLLWHPLLRLYKIGHTTGLRYRLRALRTALPGLECLATFPEGEPLEDFLHQVFADLREDGSEWFRLPVEPELAAPTIWEFARVYWEQKGEIPPSKFPTFSPTGAPEAA